MDSPPRRVMRKVVLHYNLFKNAGVSIGAARCRWRSMVAP
jgi:hypothetical protein